MHNGKLAIKDEETSGKQSIRKGCKFNKVSLKPWWTCRKSSLCYDSIFMIGKYQNGWRDTIQFSKKTKQVEKKLWWKKVKTGVIVATIVITVVIVIV